MARNESELREQLAAFVDGLPDTDGERPNEPHAFNYGVIAALTWALGWSERSPCDRRDTFVASPVD